MATDKIPEDTTVELDAEYCLDLNNDRSSFVQRGLHRSSKLDSVKTASLTIPTSNENSSNDSSGRDDDVAIGNMFDGNSSPRKGSRRVSIVLPNDILNLNQIKDDDESDTKPKRMPSVFSLNAKRNMALANAAQLDTLSYGKIEAVKTGSSQNLKDDEETQQVDNRTEIQHKQRKRVSIALAHDILPHPGDYDSDDEAKPKRKASVFARRGKARMSVMASMNAASLSLAEDDEECDTMKVPTAFPKERKRVSIILPGEISADENEDQEDKPRRKPSIFSLRKKRNSITEPPDVAPFSTPENCGDENNDDESEVSFDFGSDYELEVRMPNFQKKNRRQSVLDGEQDHNNSMISKGRAGSVVKVQESLPSLEKYALRTSCVKFKERISERKELTTMDRAASGVMQPGRRMKSMIGKDKDKSAKCLESIKMNCLKTKDFFCSTVLTSFSNVFAVILTSIAITGCVENFFPDTWRDKLAESSIATTTLGVFVTFSLVFRTNLCYNRWWECRVMWGRIVRLSCHLSQQGAAWIRHPHIRDRFLTYCICFPYASKAVLRGNNFAHDMEEGRYLMRQGLLSVDELDDIASESRHPHVCIDMMRALMNRALEKEDGLTVRGEGARDACLTSIENTIADLAEAIGALNRLKQTGLPGMYNYFVTYNTILFVVFSNLGWSVLMGWYAPVVTGFIVFVMSSLVFVGDRMLDSHGLHVVGLPLQKYCVTVEREVIKVRFRCEKFAQKVANF